MTCRESKIKGVAYSHIEILIDQNLRKDGIVKPLKEWPSAHLLHLYEILMAEVDSREELKVIRAETRKAVIAEIRAMKLDCWTEATAEIVDRAVEEIADQLDKG